MVKDFTVAGVTTILFKNCKNQRTLEVAPWGIKAETKHKMPSESRKLAKKIAQLELDLKELLKSKPTSNSKSMTKPSKIENSQSIGEVKKFTVSELKEYIKKKKIEIKKVSEKHKEDFVKIVWKHLKNSSDSDSDSSESDSDSDSSDSDSDSDSD
jgi:myo-inositol-1-phosphate synthase